jgi:hypothetical protein
MGFDASYLRSCAFLLGRQPKDTHFNNNNNNNNNKRPTHVGMNGFNGAEVSGFLNQRNVVIGTKRTLSTDAVSVCYRLLGHLGGISQLVPGWLCAASQT